MVLVMSKNTHVKKINLLHTMVRAKEIGARDVYLFNLMEGNSQKDGPELYCTYSLSDLCIILNRSEGRLRIQLKKLEKSGLIIPVYFVKRNGERFITQDFKDVLSFGLSHLSQTKYRIEIDKLIKVGK